MLPVFDVNGVPVAQMVWIKGEELRRECDSIGLEREASLSNPGWFEKAFMGLGQFLIRTGQRLYNEYTASRPASAIISTRLAQ